MASTLMTDLRFAPRPSEDLALEPGLFDDLHELRAARGPYGFPQDARPLVNRLPRPEMHRRITALHHSVDANRQPSRIEEEPERWDGLS